jgi:signal transduction histidine kinase
LEKSRTSPGTGLGLSLVKAIADLHGCQVQLDDARPGLRVRLIFPARELPFPST